MMDLSHLKPIEVSTDPASYSMLLYAQSKLGKSSFIHDLYGDEVLFAATEKRYAALEGAYVQPITNWADFLTLIRQVRKPDIKKKYKVIAIDTVENLYAFCDQYIAPQFDESSVGEGTVGYGKDWTALKNEWFRGIKALEGVGYTLVFVSHAIQNTVQVPADSLLDDDKANLEGAEKVKGDKGENLLEFLQYQPDLKASALGIVSKSVDNILFAENTVDSKGKQVRVLHLRGTLQWEAGTTFKDIKPTILFSADAYKKAINDALSKYKHTTTKRQSHADMKDVNYNFDDLMEKARNYALIFHNNDKMNEVAKIAKRDLKDGEKITQLPENRVQDLAIVVADMKDKIEELGLK